jgi:hypothetical protein
MKSNVPRCSSRATALGVFTYMAALGVSPVQAGQHVRHLLTVFCLIWSVVFATATAHAETVTVIGANGTNGSGFGGIGPATDGADATANAGHGPGPNATNTATAYCGNGGSAGVFAGNGGNATATATTSVIDGAASAARLSGVVDQAVDGTFASSGLNEPKSPSFRAKRGSTTSPALKIGSSQEF